jgi:hypothetical protein
MIFHTYFRFSQFPVYFGVAILVSALEGMAKNNDFFSNDFPTRHSKNGRKSVSYTSAGNPLLREPLVSGHEH